ncbi:hypothetical protein [Desulfoscipio gibsoniae]|uniref:Uncharacterized protein n=1 Tax=Desulfoscipio gibsoniae DSM 7213 TaxID=767817 RepID=R4KLV6_9FIRM|nr:hypothetical protein [Desulfoscipio gibsoniae]AGL03669.1 hypothetical protein Desgi_4430 [Desulfoscipio gibsoniae DSM 7213]
MERITCSGPILIKFAPLKLAKSFRSGTIYMNSLDYFRGLEDDNKVRGDLLEGTHSLIAKDDFSQVLPQFGMDFPEAIKKKIIGGIHLLDEELKYYKVFCMYQLNCDFKSRYIEPIDTRVNNFGDTFVLIFNLKEFRRRIVAELEKGTYNALGFAGQGVEYYQYDTSTQKLGPLKKLDLYKWQNEYRLIAEPLEHTLDPLILNIGDISDISIIGSTSRLIEEIHFEGKELFVPGYNL